MAEEGVMLFLLPEVPFTAESVTLGEPEIRGALVVVCWEAVGTLSLLFELLVPSVDAEIGETLADEWREALAAVAEVGRVVLLEMLLTTAWVPLAEAEVEARAVEPLPAVVDVRRVVILLGFTVTLTLVLAALV